MAFFAALFILLIAARSLGELVERFNQPAVVGELAAGILASAALLVWGPELGWFREATQSPQFLLVADAGVFFLMLMAGIDLKPREIADHGARSFFVASGGVILPLAVGTGLAWALLPESPLRLAQAVFVGVTLAVTAVPTVVKVLGDMNLLHSRVGETIVAAAIFDDVLGLVLLAVLTALIEQGSVPDLAALALMFGKVILFFAITVTLGVHVYPHISKRLPSLKIAEAEFGIIMSVGLAYAVLAEMLGMHWLMGAFMAGLYFEPHRVGFKAYNEMRVIAVGITSGFLAPVFFASIGLDVDLDAVAAEPAFCLAVIVLAVVTKFVGAGLPAWAAGLERREAVAIGSGMTARGGVGIVVVSIAIEAGLFDGVPEESVAGVTPSALVVMAIATTLIAPLLMRWALPPGRAVLLRRKNTPGAG